MSLKFDGVGALIEGRFAFTRGLQGTGGTCRAFRLFRSPGLVVDRRETLSKLREARVQSVCSQFVTFE